MLTSVRALGFGAGGAGGAGGGGEGGLTGAGGAATGAGGDSIFTGSGCGSGLTASCLGGSERTGSGLGGGGLIGSGLGGCGLGGSAFAGFGLGGSGGAGSNFGGGVINLTSTLGGSTSVCGCSSAPDMTNTISAACSTIAAASAEGLMVGTARPRLRLSADRARPACRTGQWLCAAGSERHAGCRARR